MNKKIAMITCHDENYQKLADITVPVKEAYCQKWGYEFVCKTSDFTYPNIYGSKQQQKLGVIPDIPSNRLIGFERFKMVLDLFEKNSHLDWVHFSGTDVLITNFNISLDSIIDDEYHTIVCFDANGLNDDSILIKNSLVGKGFMKWVLDNVETYRHACLYEQQAMIDFYFKMPLGKEIIKVLPQRVMNSYICGLYPHMSHIDQTGNNGNWQEGDFMLQLPGLPMQTKIQVISEHVEKIIK